MKKTALVAESDTIENENLEEIKNDLEETFNPDVVRVEDKIGMFFNPSPIFWVPPGRKDARLLYAGGMYLSLIEKHKVQQVMEEFASLNAEILDRMKEAGVQTVWKEPRSTNPPIVLDAGQE